MFRGDLGRIFLINSPYSISFYCKKCFLFPKKTGPVCPGNFFFILSVFFFFQEGGGDPGAWFFLINIFKASEKKEKAFKKKKNSASKKWVGKHSPQHWDTAQNSIGNFFFVYSFGDQFIWPLEIFKKKKTFLLWAKGQPFFGGILGG